MKNKKIILMFMLLTILISSNVAFCATVGQSLLETEQGWKRLDDQGNPEISYIGENWVHSKINTNEFNKTVSYVESGSSQVIINATRIKFDFLGSKIRLISTIYPEHSSKLIIKVDGVEQTTNLNGATLSQALIFEKMNLDYGRHSVEIFSGDGVRYALDAVEIDSSGRLMDYRSPAAPTNLTGTNIDSKIKLTWTPVNNVNQYIVKRSITQGGVYEILATIDNNLFYLDPTVVEGTDYYYVVSAVNEFGESINSNEAAIHLAKTGSAILNITMTNGEIKSFTVSIEVTDNFINWYKMRASGIESLPYFTFEKTTNIKPFTKKKEYIIFDKISSFEVNEFVE